MEPIIFRRALTLLAILPLLARAQTEPARPPPLILFFSDPCSSHSSVAKIESTA